VAARAVSMVVRHLAMAADCGTLVAGRQRGAHSYLDAHARCLG
jgi:hypothetical protein